MATILLVMKQRGNIRVLSEALEAIGHTAVPAPDQATLSRVLIQPADQRVALVDASGFRPPDWDLCQTLHNHQVRYLVVYAPNQAHAGSQAVRYGAAGFYQKPVNKPELLQLLSSLAAVTPPPGPMANFGLPREIGAQR